MSKLTAIIVYFFIYETKGKSLEHMNELYSGKLAIDESSSSSSDSDVNVSEKTAAETTAAPASN